MKYYDIILRYVGDNKDHLWLSYITVDYELYLNLKMLLAIKSRKKIKEIKIKIHEGE